MLKYMPLLAHQPQRVSTGMTLVCVGVDTGLCVIIYAI